MFNTISAQLNSEQAVTEILSHFSTDFIYDVMRDSLVKKFRPYTTPAVNYPLILERDFIQIKASNPSYVDKVELVRSETYREIINMICDAYNLTIDDNFLDESDGNMLYSAANLLYDIFVSDFTSKMVHMFVTYIISNADSLCHTIESSIEDGETKKEQNVYAKRIQGDQRIILLHNYMDKVIDIIATVDISLESLLHYFTEPNAANFLASILTDKGDIYKQFYASYIKDPITKPDMFTVLKLNLQGIFTASAGVEAVLDNKGEKK